MESSESTKVPHSAIDKGSKTPFKSRLPQPKKPTSHSLGGTSSNAVGSPERSQKIGKSTSCQDAKKPSNRVSSCVRRTCAVIKKEDDARGKAGMPERSSVKENVAPGNRGRRQVNPAVTPGVKRTATKSGMSYMELKRHHQDLLSEVVALEDRSREQEEAHWTQVNQFAKEIEKSRETNLALREEINSYQAIVNERNKQLDALQQRLEEIKFENERMAAILEGSKLDAVTGERVAKSENFIGLQTKLQLDLSNQEQVLDDFISTLESTLSQLQQGENHQSQC